MVFTTVTSNAAAFSLASHNLGRVFALAAVTNLRVADLAVGALARLAGFEKLFPHLAEVFLAVLGELHRNFLKNHVVLRQSARLVRQHKLNAAQLLRNRRVSSNGPLDVAVHLDAVLVIQFGKIQVDSHRDGDNGAEQENDSEEFEVPVADKAIRCDDRC